MMSQAPPQGLPPNAAWQALNGKPSVTVSPIGLSTAGVTQRNNGADYGPDTPSTTTSGIQEAINYVYANAVTVSVTGGPSLLMQSIRLLSGIFQINSPVTIPAPSTGSPYGPNIRIYGDGIQNTILNFNFNGSYGITISTDNQYGMFVFEGFSPNSGVGYTPSGWLEANFYGTSNAAKSNIILRDINVYPATWANKSMVVTGMIQAIFINYWDTTQYAVATGPYIGNTDTIWIGGASYSITTLDNNYMFHAIGLTGLVLQIVTGNCSIVLEDIVDLRISTAMATASPIRYLEIKNVIVNNFVNGTTNTIWAGQAGTITTLRVKSLTFSGPSNGTLLNPFITVTDYKQDGAITNTTAYTFTMPTVAGFSAPQLAVPAAGLPSVGNSVFTFNTLPYPVEIYLNSAGTGVILTVKDTNGTNSPANANFTSGQYFTLEPGEGFNFGAYTVAPTIVTKGL